MNLLKNPSTHSNAIKTFTLLQEEVRINPSTDLINSMLLVSIHLHDHSYKKHGQEFLSEALYSLALTPKTLDFFLEANFQDKLQEALQLSSDVLTSFIIETCLRDLPLTKEFIHLNAILLCEAAVLQSKCLNFKRCEEILEKVKEINEFFDFLSFSAIWITLTEGKVLKLKKNYEESINLYSKAQHTFFLKTFDEEIESFKENENFRKIDYAVFAKLHLNLMEVYLEKGEHQKASQIAIKLFKCLENIGNLQLTLKIASATLKKLLGTNFIHDFFLIVLNFCEKNSVKNEFSCFLYKIGIDLSEKNNDLESCMKYIQKIVDISKEKQFYDELFEAYVSAASLYVDFDHKRLEEILKLAESVQLNHDIQANKLKFYLLSFKLHESKNEQETSLKIIEKILDYPAFFQSSPEIILKFLRIFNNSLKSHHKYQKLQQIIIKILEFFNKKDGFHKEKLELYEIISENFQDLNDLKSSSNFLEKSLKIFHDFGLKDSEKLLSLTLKLVNILESLGEISKSIQFISSFENFEPKPCQSEDLGNLYLKGGIFQIQLKNKSESKRYLKKAQDIFASLCLFDEMKDVLRLLQNLEMNLLD
jgi:tetratricopeptide (TPR) repeat protein